MVRWSPRRGVVVISFLTVSALGMATGGIPIQKKVPAQQLPRVESVPGEVLVKLRGNKGFQLNAARSHLVSGLEAKLGANSISEIRPLITDPNLHVVRLASKQNTDFAMAALQTSQDVEFVEPNYIYRINGAADLPTDPDFAKTWGLNNVGQLDSAGQAGTPGVDVQVLPLWQQGIHGSQKTLVAVIDTGIDWTHPDLVANLYTNPGEAGDLATDGKDNDGNGFVDDVHGWNFAEHTANSSDDHNHGTHCSGTIGAQSGNDIGVVGVNWNVSLLPVKFLNAQGSGKLADAVEAINYARMMKAKVYSNSWGGGGYSKALEDAIRATDEAGGIFIAAAGNESNDNDKNPSYPATYDIPNVVSVAAIDNRGKLASFSNYGAKSVHVAAPGVKIYSTVKGGGYEWFSGTSMATPHVAGIAALLLSEHPEWNAQEVKKRLITTSEPSRELRKKVAAHGRVQAANALFGVVPPSNEPDPSLWREVSFHLESDHPYADNANLKFEINQPGVKFVKIHFEKVDVENYYDQVTVESASGEVIDKVSGLQTDYWSEPISADQAVIHLKSDTSNTSWGFSIDKIAVIQ